MSLDVDEGEFVAIVGRSGSGKSTLLNIVGLLDDQWEGQYEIEGNDVRTIDANERDQLRASEFGFVFQSSHANPYESVAQNAALGLAIRGLPLDLQAQTVMSALTAVGLEHKSEALARTLSGGERQRLAIARAIATKPKVLLADEPTGNLDSHTAGRVMHLFRDLNHSGTTVIVVTHDPSVARFARRTITVEDGAVLGEDVDHSRPRTAIDRPPRVAGGTGPTAGATTARLSRLARKAQDRIARAVNNLTARPLRSVSLIAAFALATAGLVTAAGVSASASQQISDRLAQAALDEVWVSVPPELPVDTRASWVEALRGIDGVVEVGQVAPLEATQADTARFVSDRVEFSGTTVALDSAALEVFEAAIVPASARSAFEDHERVALVGHEVAVAMGVDAGAFGSEIWAGGRPYSVIGVVTDAPRGLNLPTSVILPISEIENPPVQLLVRTAPGFSAAVAEAAPLALEPANPAQVGVSTTGDLRNLRLGVSTDLDGLLVAVSAALLLLALLSASSAMFLSVQSRTQEVALSRALGLSRSGVASIFLWEGVVIGFAGALAGISIGLICAVTVAAARDWTAVVPWAVLASTPLLGCVCGALSAFLPALRASRIDPADAIR